MTEEKTLYEAVGGDATFKALVDHFYALIAQDPLLREVFPQDLEPGKYWQFLFLTQYWGGPSRYIQERGHPRLRMRHMPFEIDQQARDHWVAHMLASIDAVGIQEPYRTEMRNYFEQGGTFLINRISADSVKGEQDGDT